MPNYAFKPKSRPSRKKKIPKNFQVYQHSLNATGTGNETAVNPKPVATIPTSALQNHQNQNAEQPTNRVLRPRKRSNTNSTQTRRVRRKVQAGTRRACPRKFCYNCKRHEEQGSASKLSSDYDLQLRKVKVSDIVKSSGKCMTFTKATLAKQKVHKINLCVWCDAYLKDSDRTMVSNQWPGYLWKCILKADANGPSYCKKLVRAIPMEWWQWYPSNILPNRLRQVVERRSASPVAQDISATVDKINTALGELKLGNLMKVINEDYHATTLCPWGCSEYPTKTGEIPLDTYLEHYVFDGDGIGLMKRKGSETVTKALSYIQNARDDFLRNSRLSYESQLFNEEWCVLPSLKYTKGEGPTLCTCRDHSGGTKKLFFHVPRTPRGLAISSRQPDQLAHAAPKPRVVDGTKRSFFNTSFATLAQNSQYGGVDTMDLTEYRNFGIKSIIRGFSEAVTVCGREDIKALISQLLDGGVISADLARSLAEGPEHFGITLDELDENCIGSTFMTLEDSISLQEQLVLPNTKYLEEKVFIAPWQKKLTWLHKFDSHGAKFPRTPNMNDGATFPIWCMVSAMTCVDTIWEICDQSVQHSENIFGYLLTYISNVVCEKGTSGVCSQLGNKSLPGQKQPFYLDDYRKNTFTTSFRDKLLQANMVSNTVKSRDAISPFLNLSSIREIRSPRSVQNFTQIQDGFEPDDVILVSFDTSDGWEIPFEFTTTTGTSYELRFMCFTDIINETDHDNYKACWFARHGGKQFDQWWMQRRKGRVIKAEEAHQFQWHLLYMAVFVRKIPADIEKLRKKFLSFIGGQTKSVCALHQSSLAISDKKASERKQMCCCGTDAASVTGICEKTAVYCCPVVGCEVYLCSVCHAVNAENEEATLIHPPREAGLDTTEDEITEQPQVPTAKEDNDDINSVDINSVIQDDEWEWGEIDTDDECSTADRGDNDSHSQQHSSEEVNEGSLDDIIIDDVIFGDDEVAIESGDMPVTNGILQSVSGKQLPTFTITNTPFRVQGHVILNNCGTCLTRSNDILSGTKRAQNFCQRLVSTCSEVSIPLTYPEAMICPSTFYRMTDTRGPSYLGAIPAALLAQPKITNSAGFGSVLEHARIRLKSPGSRASTDKSYLSFIYDAVTNIAMTGHDSRIVVRRGFGIDKTTGDSRINVRGADDSLHDSQINSKAIVNGLNASDADDSFTLFLTITANMKTMFGLRPLEEWVCNNRGRIREIIAEKMGGYVDTALPSTIKELDSQIDEMCCILYLRQWMEVSDILVDYLQNSDEKPLGNVTKIVCRKEQQTDPQKGNTGNLPHLHIIIATEEKLDTPGGKEFLYDLVRGKVDDLVRSSEVQDLISEGILRDEDDLLEVKQLAERILFHRCSARCSRRTGTGDAEVSCRAPDINTSSPNPHEHTLTPTNEKHSEEAMSELFRLGLIDNPCTETMEENCQKHIYNPIVPELDNRKHVPPSRKGEGKISPCNGRLFAALRANMNLQIVSKKWLVSYLTKYCVKMDENNRVFARVGKNSRDEIRTTIEFLHNTKITSSAIHEAVRAAKSRNKNKPCGRMSPLPEMQQLILGFPELTTNLNFIYTSTAPLECRSGVAKAARCTSMYDNNGEQRDIQRITDIYEEDIPAVQCRKTILKLPKWRLPTDTQILIAKDSYFSAVSIDRITLFSLRPPELMCFDNPKIFFACFEREKKKDKGTRKAEEMALLMFSLNDNLSQSVLYDVLGYRYRLRPEASDVLQKFLSDRGRNLKRPIRQFLHQLCDYIEKIRTNSKPRDEKERTLWNLLDSHIVCEPSIRERLSNNVVPIVVMSPVMPFHGPKFLLHVLLTMGKYDTEADMLMEGDIKLAFIKAKLLPRYHVTQSDIDALTKRYILEVLSSCSISAKKFDMCVIEMGNLFQSVFIRNEMPSNDIPPCLYTAMQDKQEDDIKDYLKKRQRNMAGAACKEVANVPAHHNLPTEAQLTSGTITRENPHPWDGTWTKTAQQTTNSFIEQHSAFRQIKDGVDSYCLGKTTLTKNRGITGGPGTGKSFIMMLGATYAMSKGLTVLTTALQANRSGAIGGMHLHRLFCLDYSTTGKSPQQQAENAILRIIRNPVLFQYLTLIDVLFLDEAGQISAELLSVIDIILRKIRRSQSFLGGVFLVGTLDEKQLLAITGHPFLLSAHLITTFRFFRLKESVRAANDVNLREIQTISRAPSRTIRRSRATRERFRNLASTSFTFVDDWSDPRIPNHAYVIYPKRAPVKRTEQNHIDMERQKYTAQSTAGHNAAGAFFVERHAKDEEQRNHSHAGWEKATENSRKTLTYKCNEPPTIAFYKFAIFSFTENDETAGFSNTQLGILTEEPTKEQIDTFGPINIMVAPPDMKSIPFEIESEQQLLQRGFRKTTVRYKNNRQKTHVIGGKKIRRTQYPLKHFIAGTVHSVQGATISSMVTRLSTKDEDYRIWDKRQLVVLLSRTRRAKDLIFVGDKEDNLNALCNLLTASSQYDEYLEHVLDKLVAAQTGENIDRFTIDTNQLPLKPKFHAVPLDDSGYCYALISWKNKTTTYIGQTFCLGRRLLQHNAGQHTKQTSPQRLRPWTFLAYVAGFDKDKSKMLEFEGAWRRKREFHCIQNHGYISPAALIQCAEELVHQFNNDYQIELRTVQMLCTE